MALNRRRQPAIEMPVIFFLHSRRVLGGSVAQVLARLRISCLSASAPGEVERDTR